MHSSTNTDIGIKYIDQIMILKGLEELQKLRKIEKDFAKNISCSFNLLLYEYIIYILQSRLYPTLCPPSDWSISHTS